MVVSVFPFSPLKEMSGGSAVQLNLIDETRTGLGDTASGGRGRRSIAPHIPDISQHHCMSSLIEKSPKKRSVVRIQVMDQVETEVDEDVSPTKRIAYHVAKSLASRERRMGWLGGV